jgi:protein-tyrosine phosphatase
VQQAVAPHQTVGLRVPGHQVTLDILQMIAGPLVLTSANRAGEPEAKTAEEALKALGDDVALILDDGPSRFGAPSSVVRVREDGFEVLREGVVPERALKRLANTMVLFVCTGNTCRSPMAEWIFRKLAAKRLGCGMDEIEDNGLVVRSAGISAGVGGMVSPEVLEVLGGECKGLQSHETQPVTETLVRNADVIYTMTPSHRQAIVAQWPDAAGRTIVLAADGSSVVDPIGGSIDRYRQCAKQIENELDARLDELDL